MNKEFKDKISQLEREYGTSCSYERVARIMTEDVLSGEVVHDHIIREKDFSNRSFDALRNVQQGDLFGLDVGFNRLIWVDPNDSGSVHTLRELSKHIPDISSNVFASRLVLKCISVTDDYIKCKVFGMPAYKSGIHEIWILKTDAGNYNFHRDDFIVCINHYNPYLYEYIFSMECVEEFKKYMSVSRDLAKQYFEIAEEVYPERVDTYSRSEDGMMREVKLEGSAEHAIVIHFPELEVTNRNSLVHKVKDLYVSITLDRACQVIGFYGCRMTMEAKEINTNYGMSHCSNGVGKWSGWCTGSGDFATSKAVLRNEFNPELFEIWLTQLRYYLEWESLSGGPYKRIEQAIRGSTTSGSNYISRIDINNFMKDIVEWEEDVNRFFVATINDYGMDQTDISISGSRDLATAIFNLSADDRAQVFKRYPMELIDKQVLTSVSETGDMLGVLKLDLAKRIAKDKKDLSSLTFPFQGETVEFKTYVNESLYKESYEAPILDINNQIKDRIHSILSKKVMYHLINDVKQTAKSNTKYDDFKQQNREFPEEILACTTVY